jgi:Ni,Fe-hydrogenase I cytochrome b subunit
MLLYLFVLDYVKLQVNGNEKVIFLHRELNWENILKIEVSFYFFKVCIIKTRKAEWETIITGKERDNKNCR